MTLFLSILERSWVGHFWDFFLKNPKNFTSTIFSTYNPKGGPFYMSKNASIFGSILGSILGSFWLHLLPQKGPQDKVAKCLRNVSILGSPGDPFWDRFSMIFRCFFWIVFLLDFLMPKVPHRSPKWSPKSSKNAPKRDLAVFEK